MSKNLSPCSFWELLIRWQMFGSLRLLEKGNLTGFPSTDREESWCLSLRWILLLLLCVISILELLLNDGYYPSFSQCPFTVWKSLPGPSPSILTPRVKLLVFPVSNTLKYNSTFLVCLCFFLVFPNCILLATKVETGCRNMKYLYFFPVHYKLKHVHSTRVEGLGCLCFHLINHIVPLPN